MKTVIGITARGGQSGDNRILRENEDYFRYILEAGGFPVLVYAQSEADAETAAECLDGLVVSGGADCDPSLYGEENTFSIPVEADIERSDLLLYKAFRKAGKPVFGICRGMQLINAAEGGTLIQDILKERPSSHEHSQRDLVPPLPKGSTAHVCVFSEGTLMHEIFGDSHPVNSYHHQAVKKTAPGFTVSGLSDDGLPEAMEKENVTAVQWHPERLRHDPKQMRMMERFIADCSAKKAG